MSPIHHRYYSLLLTVQYKRVPLGLTGLPIGEDDTRVPNQNILIRD